MSWHDLIIFLTYQHCVIFVICVICVIFGIIIFGGQWRLGISMVSSSPCYTGSWISLVHSVHLNRLWGPPEGCQTLTYMELWNQSINRLFVPLIYLFIRKFTSRCTFNTTWLDGTEVSTLGKESGGPRFPSHPRLTFQSCSRYQLNQLGSKAASQSTFKKSNTCGLSNTRIYFSYTFTTAPQRHANDTSSFSRTIDSSILFTNLFSTFLGLCFLNILSMLMILFNQSGRKHIQFLCS